MSSDFFEPTVISKALSALGRAAALADEVMTGLNECRRTLISGENRGLEDATVELESVIKSWGVYGEMPELLADTLRQISAVYDEAEAKAYSILANGSAARSYHTAGAHHMEPERIVRSGFISSSQIYEPWLLSLALANNSEKEE